MPGNFDRYELFLGHGILIGRLLQQQLLRQLKAGHTTIVEVEHQPEDGEEKKETATDSPQEPVQFFEVSHCHFQIVGHLHHLLRPIHRSSLDIERWAALEIASVAHESVVAIVPPWHDRVVHQSGPQSRLHSKAGAKGVRGNIDLRGVRPVELELHCATGIDHFGGEVEFAVVVAEQIGEQQLLLRRRENGRIEGVGLGRRSDDQRQRWEHAIEVDCIVLDVIRHHQTVLEHNPVDILCEILRVAETEGLLEVGSAIVVHEVGVEVLEDGLVAVQTAVLLVADRNRQLVIIPREESLRAVEAAGEHRLVIVARKIALACRDVDPHANGDEQQRPQTPKDWAALASQWRLWDGVERW